MPDIFLSYKREDAAAAARLVEGLRGVGFDVWWDADIPIGAAWEATIERALTDARLVLVCWSRVAVASDNVRSEARWAREQGRLIQLFVEPCEPPLFFGERQGIDVSHWRGDAADPPFRRLVTQIQATLGGGASGEAAAPPPAPPPGELAAWLATLDLARYAAAFAAAEVNLATLPELDDADLREIGIPLGPRRRILAALAGGLIVPAPVAPPAPRAAPPAPPHVGAAERRQVTVMAVDLVGSARLSAEIDPEEMAELLARYRACVASGVAAAGGRVVKAAGEGVLACFGWPLAREDAAEAAIRAGFRIIADVAGITGAAGYAPRSRIGVATGLVVVGGEADGAAGEVSLTGEAPHLAAGLGQSAEPGTLAIADSTYRQIGRLFECEVLPEQFVGGFSTPIRAWRPLREVPHLSRFRAARAVQTAFVGRAHELSLLIDRWHSASDGNGRTVVILAEAGMGKSRLVDALHHRIAGDPHEAITWQCSPYHQIKPLYPVVEYLTHAAGIVDADPPAEQLRKLAALLATARVPPDGNLSLFAELLAIDPEAGFAPTAMPANQARAATITALTWWLHRLADAKPLLFVLEDAHWIDATTLELLTRAVAVASDVPILLVITARPEFASPWSGRAEVSTVGLDRLGKRDCEALAREVAGAAALRDGTVEEILARSDGNPLFVEELSATVRDTEGAAAKGVPDSLQSSLMARLDRLGDAKQTAQIGSVLGRRFARPLLVQVADLAPDLIDANLALLIEHDVIRPIGGGGDGRYEFKHALVRDAAYESMLLAQRRRLHAACGRALEQSFPEVARTEPELLAQHFALAGMAAEAVSYAERAGDRATAACAYREAISSYEEALRQNDQLAAGPDRERRALDLLLKLGPAIGMIRGAQDPAMRDIYGRAEALSRTAGDSDALFKAVWGLWYHANISRQLEDAAALAERLVEIGERSGDADLALEAIHCRWSSALFRGDYHQCTVDAGHGVERYDRDRHHKLGIVFGGHDPGVCALGCSGQAKVFTGNVEAGFATINEGIALAEALDHPGSLAHAVMMGLVAATAMGLPDLLRLYAERMLDVARRFNLPPQQAMATYHLAWIEAETGDRSAGLEQMAALHDRVTAIGPMILLYKVMYIDQLLKAGRAEEALAAADRAVAGLSSPNAGLVLSELLRLRGECLATLGRRDDGMRELTRAEAMAARDGATPFRLRAATALHRAGGDEARALVAAALATMPSDWNGPEVTAARRAISSGD